MGDYCTGRQVHQVIDSGFGYCFVFGVNVKYVLGAHRPNPKQIA